MLHSKQFKTTIRFSEGRWGSQKNRTQKKESQERKESHLVEVPMLLKESFGHGVSYCESCLLHRATARVFSQRIYFGVRIEENLLANQTVMRHAAHLPSFKNQQMCNFFCRLLIFRRLKNGMHPEVNSLKMMKGYLPTQWSVRGKFADNHKNLRLRCA